jgi:C4-dicarboxylate transporter DctM subunit
MPLLFTDPLIITLLLFAVLLFLLLCGVWIGFTLFSVGVVGMLLYQTNLPASISIWDKIGGLMATSVWNSLNSWSITALPLFILMGEILFRTSISTRLLNGLVPWLSRIPGRLLHVNIVACSLFAAVSGSSAATTATVGKITLDELSRRGYNRSLAIGSLAGAGTLGFLIPPSLIMIIYGVLSDTSIGKLFASGILPGLLLATLYSTYIIIRAKIEPGIVPDSAETYTLKQKLAALKELVPVVLLVVAVLGGIYLGVTTPTEAAAIGVIGALVLAAGYRNLSWENVREALLNAVRTTCMICFIIAGAAFLSQVVAFVGVARGLSEYIVNMQVSPYVLLMVLGVMYLILGMILDGISIVVMTLPIVLPIVLAAGFDPIWFGVYLVIMVELSQITPPVGFSLFVIQGISQEPVSAIIKATIPFFLLMILAVVMIAIWPDIVMYLPNQMSK